MDAAKCAQARQDVEDDRVAVSNAHEAMNHAHFRVETASRAVDAANGRVQDGNQAVSAAQFNLDRYDDTHQNPGPGREQLVADLNQAKAARDEARQELDRDNGELREAKEWAAAKDGDYQDQTKKLSNSQDRVSRYCS